jgi:hypothetical protein
MKSTALVFLLFLFGGVQSAQSQKKPAVVPNKHPTIEKFESSSPTVYTGGAGVVSSPFGPVCFPKARQTVTLTITANDPEDDSLNYEYSVTGGRIVGTGSSVSWRLGDENRGRYLVTVKVKDDKGAEASSTLQVVVADCPAVIGEPPCPTREIEISSPYTDPKETFRGELLTFHAIAGMDWFVSRPDYKWTVTGGKIVKGHNTPWITVEANGEVGSFVSATVEFEGVEPYCTKTGKSASVLIKN